DITPPAVLCPSGVGAECAGPNGAPVMLVATATDACSTSSSLQNDRTPTGADASGTYPQGTTQVHFTATDAAGNVATCASAVTVRDTMPPVLTALADPPSLWPPNHTLIPVHVSWQARDLCDPSPSVVLVSATSSEPDDAPGTGDGNTLGDIEGAQPGTADGVVL